MNKTKLILRSLLLMLLLWAVNAIVLKWPVHIDQKPKPHYKSGTFIRDKNLPPARSSVRAYAPSIQPIENGKGLMESNSQTDKVRHLSLD